MERIEEQNKEEEEETNEVIPRIVLDRCKKVSRFEINEEEVKKVLEK